jgi:hypothetical protein
MLLGPIAPRRAVEFLQRVVHGVAAQRLAARGAELRELARAPRALRHLLLREALVELAEDRALGGRDLRVIDLGRGAQASALLAPALRERAIVRGELAGNRRSPRRRCRSG